MEDENCTICRLCLNKTDEENPEKLEGFQREMVQCVLLDVNFNTEDPVMCSPCSQNLQKSYQFKLLCLNTQTYIRTFANCLGNKKVNLEEAVLNEPSSKEDKKKREICRLCFALFSVNFIDLNRSDCRQMLSKCIPELNMNLTDDPVVCCQQCFFLLKTTFLFVTTCFEVEEKINRCCSIIGDSPVYLNSILELSKTVKLENNSQDSCMEESEIFLSNVPEDIVKHEKCDSETNVKSEESDELQIDTDTLPNVKTEVVEEFPMEDILPNVKMEKVEEVEMDKYFPNYQ